MKIGELKEKLSHYPDDVEVTLGFDDIKEFDTCVEPCIYWDSFSLKKYDVTNKRLFILPSTFNEKYTELYEKYLIMKNQMKEVEEDYEERIQILGYLVTKYIYLKEEGTDESVEWEVKSYP